MHFGNVSFPGIQNPELGFPTTSSYSYERTSAPRPRSRARVPAHNCMKELLGESVPGFQLSGRGILRNFLNKVVILNTLIVPMAKQKTTPVEETKNLQETATCRFFLFVK